MTRIALPTHERIVVTSRGDTITLINGEYAAKHLPMGFLSVFSYFEDDEGEIRPTVPESGIILDRHAQDVLHKLTAPKIDEGLMADWEMCDRKHGEE